MECCFLDEAQLIPRGPRNVTTAYPATARKAKTYATRTNGDLMRQTGLEDNGNIAFRIRFVVFSYDW